MKTNNIFDLLDTETTVADNTVIVDTGVSTQRVTQLVKEAINMNDNSKVIPMKKKSRTAFRLTALIAAVIAGSIVTASAMGGFHQVFGSLFFGESSDGIYSGSDINIESDSTIVDFLGIAGDQYIAAASMKLTRTNGENYVDNISDTWISSSSPDTSEESLHYLFGNIYDNVSYTCPKWFADKYPLDMDGSDRTDVHSTLNFYFDDCSTISAYISSSTYIGNIKGETMTASVDSLSAYTVTKILYDYSEHTSDNINSYGFVTNTDFSNNIVSIVKEYGTGEKDGVRVKINPETNDIVLAKETPLDISFSLSVKMNYKNSSNVYKLTNLSQSYEPWKNGAEGKITATPYNMILDITVSEPVAMTYDNALDEFQDEAGYFLPYLLDDTNAESEIPGTLTVKLTNGETISAHYQGDIGDTYSAISDSIKDYGKYNAIYQFYTDGTGDGTRLHPIAINPNDINSIEVNGAVIYSR